MRIAVLSEALAGLGGAEKHGLTLVESLIGCNDVDIFYKAGTPIELGAIERRFGIDLSGARLVPIEHLWAVSRITAGYDLFVNITFGNLTINRAKKGILLIYFPSPLDDRQDLPLLKRVDLRIFQLQESLLSWLDSVDRPLVPRSFREYLDSFGWGRAATRLPLFAIRKLAWLGGPGRYRLGSPALESYDRLLANSEYSAGWSETYYGRMPEVLYPPIDTGRFLSATKEPMVLSVGRFQPEPSSKQHHLMLATFKTLHDEGVLSGWKLCLCGGSDGSPAYHHYITRLRREAEGYPVEIEVNVPLSRLEDLYGRASLYWHAMGYGQDPREHPGRFEHFGMTTVEAMAAGCVPMVINAGGQPEIVTHEEDGFLWDSPGDLEGLVRRFMAMPGPGVDAMREAARERAGRFGRGPFLRRACEVFRSLGVPYRQPVATGDVAREMAS